VGYGEWNDRVNDGVTWPWKVKAVESFDIVCCVLLFFLYLGGLAPNGFRYAVGNYIFTAIVRYKFGRSRERLSHVYALSLCRTEKKTCFQSYRSSAFMGRSSQNFAHLQSTMGTIYRKSLTGGYRRKFWENRQKPGIFALVHAKARTVFTSGSKVERTPCRPLSYGSTAVLSVQKFVSVPEL